MVTRTRTKAETEEWASAIAGTVFVRRLDRDGDLTKDIEILGGGRVKLTREERELNQEGCASAALDPFANGMLLPVGGVDAAVKAVIASNPNVLTPEEAKTLILEPDSAEFDRRLGEITEVRALDQLEEAAKAADAPNSRLGRVRARRDQVLPSFRREGVDPVFGRALSPR